MSGNLLYAHAPLSVHTMTLSCATPAGVSNNTIVIQAVQLFMADWGNNNEPNTPLSIENNEEGDIGLLIRFSGGGFVLWFPSIVLVTKVTSEAQAVECVTSLLRCISRANNEMQVVVPALTIVNIDARRRFQRLIDIDALSARFPDFRRSARLDASICRVNTGTFVTPSGNTVPRIISLMVFRSGGVVLMGATSFGQLFDFDWQLFRVVERFLGVPTPLVDVAQPRESAHDGDSDVEMEDVEADLLRLQIE